ncbi:hypothetical protein G9G39_03835 [Cronobacter sp. EKM101R]|uniref:phage baseplate plug family protein n=1 Tax=Cronobacter TaxID=413496 RepID=UPI0013EAD586|nr:MULTISPECIES: hypothetical protein [Cronobacter]KAF6596209.1 hypothetical protein G9G39_03835 [Cronobacter sp. EKM101R]KAF6599036.1 hypothetical protein G9G38_03480 [Cronobacter sp. EKM102R]MDK1204201.1 hypothetical protein [Cronobacter turicensis]MDK1214258.1 hypothetical protein [Cronobacter turicensis]MDK1233304.1 hypothetical protein [Cronobacter turicensis]
MSKTLYPFSGNEQKSMIFTPVLDGEVYNCQIKWNIASQRWYLNVMDNSGSRILTVPLIASPVGVDFNMLIGVFTSKMIWRQSSGQIEVIT